MKSSNLNNCTQSTSVQMVPEISEFQSQEPLEVPLKPGQRYGWWEDHEHGDMHGLATIHGAVNDSRTRILVDTVKITLGSRVVYVLNIWVGNIGEGVDVLQGMNFRHSAGVLLCIREGLVKLPDEETVATYDNDPKSRGMDLPRKAYICVPVRMLLYESGMASPIPNVSWCGLGEKNWVAKVLYSARSWATAVKVVNVSDQNVWIHTRTADVRIVEYGQFPRQPGFVRPGKARYEEWQQLIHECTVSCQTRMRAERLELILRERGPPCTQTQRYQWPTKLLMRPQS
ncbi:hypothetical protein PHMEG_00011063 [Phytophthora megakarya]|uniref:Aspartic protease n=1 Tax=Phytophthora megakarya TaxID=4795 RepID=A0A225WEM9_9STRA|nr:hypothetical protein PHMEG_00011063 [Phytophthora megakarya]